MKRDPDLIRSLLMYFEAKPNDQVDSCPTIPEYTVQQVRYHLLLMYEAGFLRAEPELTKTGRVIKIHPFSLTWQGHEFLDASRDESVWRKATSTAAAKTGALSFSVLQALLISMAKQQLGI